MNIARIIDGIVENIEVADQEWLDIHQHANCVLVPYEDDNPAYIGLRWSKEEGFEQPPIPVAPTQP
jgi:hypothetical protein